jgi:hypothetical protein
MVEIGADGNNAAKFLEAACHAVNRQDNPNFRMWMNG